MCMYEISNELWSRGSEYSSKWSSQLIRSNSKKNMHFVGHMHSYFCFQCSTPHKNYAQLKQRKGIFCNNLQHATSISENKRKIYKYVEKNVALTVSDIALLLRLPLITLHSDTPTILHRYFIAIFFLCFVYTPNNSHIPIYMYYW